VTPRATGALLAAVQAALLAAIGGHYALDRARSPHGWARVAPVDPDLPVRGRYVALRLEVDGPTVVAGGFVTLDVEGDRVTARPAEPGWGLRTMEPGASGPRLEDPVAFYLPEHAADPPWLRGGDLWAEVTVPPAGPPRPLRLGVMRAGRIEPLAVE
jgi:hypothetical protein